MGIAIFLIAMWVLPWAVIKAYEFEKRRRNKNWSDKDADVIDNWKYPSNF